MHLNQSLEKIAACVNAHQYETASILIKQIEDQYPQQPDLFNLKGVMALELGAVDQARQYFETACQLKTDFAPFYNNLGLAYKAQKQFEKAIPLFITAIQLQQNRADFHYNLGLTYQEIKSFDLALTSFQQALLLGKDSQECEYSIASILYWQGHYSAAKKIITTLLKQEPTPKNIRELAIAIFLELDDISEALTLAEPLLTERPVTYETLNQTGMAYSKAKQYEQALLNFETALNLFPERIEAYSNLGLTYARMGFFNKALNCYKKALSINPEHLSSRYNYAQENFRYGNLSTAWDYYESRLEVLEGKDYPLFHQFSKIPVFSGQLDKKGTLLICREQGVGDELLFASCLKEAACCVKTTLVLCHPKLYPLLKRSFPSIHFYTSTTENIALIEKKYHIDYRISMGSLPKIFRRTLSDFYKKSPYIVADTEKTTAMRLFLASKDTHQKIGIIWRSSVVNSERSPFFTQIDDWQALFNLNNISLVNLQYDDCEQELIHIEKKYGLSFIRPPCDLLNDLDGTAALLMSLDAIVGVNTATTELAGALGIPCSLVVHKYPQAWMYGSFRHPWHDKTKLFFQKNKGEWQHAIQSLIADLGSQTMINHEKIIHEKTS